MTTGLTKQNIDAVLAAKSMFKNGGTDLYKRRTEPLSANPYVYSDDLKRFLSILRNEGFVVPSFDWARWRDEAQGYVDTPEQLESADLATIQKLLTTHVRLDRFNGGHFAEMIEKGHIQAILDRLEELRDEMKR